MATGDDGTLTNHDREVGREPDAEGFVRWGRPRDGRFTDILGAVRLRVEGDRVRARMDVEHRHTNPGNAIHGGLVLSFIDVMLFVGPVMLGRLARGGGVTLGLSTDFIGASRPDRTLDVVIEIVGETGRLLFLSGRVEQEGAVTAAFTGTLRKTPARDAPAPAR